MAYDFSRLTPAQEWLLVLQGWHVGSKLPDGSPFVQPGKRTVKKLIERGLVVPCERVIDGKPFAMTVIEYHVPLDVHLAFCMSAGDNNSGKQG